MHKRISTIICGTTVLSGLMTVGTAFAWGPSDRPTYTNDSPADYATFNSITNNAAVGDERNFVRVKEAGTNDYYSDEVKVEPGKEYEVYLYYHNDAGSDTNASGLGIALLTRAAATYPAKVTKGSEGVLTGEITWKYITSTTDSVRDGKVWDEAYLKTDYDEVVLRYKPGSAIIHNGGKANGSVLSTSLFAEGGTLIGYNELKGVIPGCAEFSGHITYTLVAEKVDSTFNKVVSLDGENWSDEVTAKPGDYVTYRVSFQNTGNTTLTNVILKDVHDEGLTLRPGSTKVFDINNESGKIIDDLIDTSGYNTGDAVPTSLVQVVYQAQVSQDESFCNKSLNNTMTASYNSTEQKTDGATVLVACDEPEPPLDTCETNPTLEGCDPIPTPEPEPEPTPTVNPIPNPTPTPEPEKNCKTNPEMEGCDKLPSTGPLEIVMAVLVVLGVAVGGYYLYRTRRTLKTVENDVTGKDVKDAKAETKPEDNAKDQKASEEPKENDKK